MLWSTKAWHPPRARPAKMAGSGIRCSWHPYAPITSGSPDEVEALRQRSLDWRLEVFCRLRVRDIHAVRGEKGGDLLLRTDGDGSETRDIQHESMWTGRQAVVVRIS